MYDIDFKYFCYLSKILFQFPIWQHAKNKSCFGSHLGFLINTKKTYVVKSIFIEHSSHACFQLVSKFQIRIYFFLFIKFALCCGDHLGFWIDRYEKNYQPFIIQAQFGVNQYVISQQKYVLFTIRVICKTMSCGGHHLGIPMDINTIC